VAGAEDAIGSTEAAAGPAASGLSRHAWIEGPDEARTAMRERVARLRADLGPTPD
jgi:hypothetical protein